MSPNDPAMLQRRRKGHLSAEEKAEGIAAASTTTATTPQKTEDLAQDSRFDPSQMALITQEMVHVPDTKEGRTEVPAECSGEEMLALQDLQRPNGSEAQVKEGGDTWEGGPRGLPVALMPPGIQGSPEPLFTPEQAKQLEESQMQAYLHLMVQRGCLWQHPQEWRRLIILISTDEFSRWRKKDSFSSGRWGRRRWQWQKR